MSNNKCLRKDIFGQCVIVNEIVGNLTPTFNPKPSPKQVVLTHIIINSLKLRIVLS